MAHFSQSCIPQDLQWKPRKHTNTSQQLGNQRHSAQCQGRSCCSPTLPSNWGTSSHLHSHSHVTDDVELAVNLTRTSLDWMKKPANPTFILSGTTSPLPPTTENHLEQSVWGHHLNVEKYCFNLTADVALFSHTCKTFREEKDPSPYRDVLKPEFPGFWAHFISMDKLQTAGENGTGWSERCLWIPGVSSAKVTKARGDSDDKIAHLCFTSPTLCKFCLQTNCTV